MSRSNTALKKGVFHSLKYINSDVVGFLTSEQSNTEFAQCDAMPVCHTRITSPFISISFELIQEALKENEKIIGVYESYTNYQSKPEDYISPITMRLAEIIKEKNSNAKVLIVTLNFDSSVPDLTLRPELKNSLEKKDDDESWDFEKELPEEAFKSQKNMMEYDLMKKAVVNIKEFEFENEHKVVLKKSYVMDKNILGKDIQEKSY